MASASRRIASASRRSAALLALGLRVPVIAVVAQPLRLGPKVGFVLALGGELSPPGVAAANPEQENDGNTAGDVAERLKAHGAPPGA